MQPSNKRRKINEKSVPPGAPFRQEGAHTPRASQRIFPPIVVAILGGALLLIVLAGVGVVWLAGSGATARPTLQAVTAAQPAAPLPRGPTQAPAPTAASGADGVTAGPTASVVEPGGAAQCYAEGVAAYERQEWQPAAAQFQCVYNADQHYQDIQEKLSATYYNWGVQLLNQGNAAVALDKFNTTLAIRPDHQLALEQQRRLVPYLDALSAIQRQDWVAGVDRLERLRAIQSDFLDSVPLLYNAYISYGAALERGNQPEAALRVYHKAAVLPVADTARAKARAAALSARLAPTPTPTAPPARTFVAAIKRNFAGSGHSEASAACISGHITAAGGPVDAAVVEVTNGPGLFSATSGAGGFYKVCGLGAAYWIVTLAAVPGDPPLGGRSAAVVYVNGGAAQEAVVDFVEH